MFYRVVNVLSTSHVTTQCMISTLILKFPYPLTFLHPNIPAMLSTSRILKFVTYLFSNLQSWSVKSSLKHFSHYSHFFSLVTPFFEPHITRALLPPNGCPSHRLWWWHCKKPRPAFGRCSWLSYPPLEHFFKYFWLSLDFWLAFLGARCIYIYKLKYMYSIPISINKYSTCKKYKIK